MKEQILLSHNILSARVSMCKDDTTYDTIAFTAKEQKWFKPKGIQTQVILSSITHAI